MKPIFPLLTLLSICFSLTTCDKFEDPPTNGLELYLPFDGNLSDKSINKNNGITQSSINFVKGRWNDGLDFNGTSDYVQLSKNINGGHGLTFSFWMKLRNAVSSENNGSIICKYNMTLQRRSFMIYAYGAYDNRYDNRLSAAFYRDSSSSAIHDHVKSYMESSELTGFQDPTRWTILNPQRINVDVWTHCVVNVTSKEVQIWVNNVLCAKKNREYELYYDSPNEPIYIGNNFAIGQGTNNHFNGTLDELRIYSRGLTKDEIRILYRNK